MEQHAQHRVFVTRDGWDGSVDELAELLASRFHRPAFRLRMALQRGEVEIDARASAPEAAEIVDELKRIGVQARAEHAGAAAAARAARSAPSAHAAATRLGRSGVTLSAAPAPGTVLGMPARGAEGRTLQGTPIGAIRALVEEGVPQPLVAPLDDGGWDVGELDLVEIPAESAAVPPASGPPPRAPAAEPPRSAAAAPASGWGAVLGSVWSAGAGAGNPPPPTVDAPAPRAANEPSVEAGRVPAGAQALAGATILYGEAPAPQPTAEVASDASERPETGAPPAPFEEAAFGAELGPGVGQPREAAPEGWRRLRSPEPPRVPRANGSGWRPALWSVLAPGAGQVANGEFTRGVTFALSGWLVLPWIWSVVDAWRVAARGAGPGVRWTHPLRLVAAFWVVVALFAFGLLTIRSLSYRDPLPVHAPEVVFAPVVDGARAQSEADEQEARARLERMDRARDVAREAAVACDGARWETCLELAERALDADDTNRDALRLQVQASMALRAEPPEPAEGSAEPAPVLDTP